ncbi:MAG: TrpR-like protein YerC/YecD [Clostridiales bacterium]|nr:TrpR-like protein YerC/YecD [Clostridiales bacterium]MBQ2816786.1 helix-turn-helix domain-containing protein [Clostridia bacterium]MBQ4637797.1 helix-turn-helix domain-containing protein [Clostridia bacterium]
MYRSKLDSKDMDALFEAILSLETTEECHRFFDDLCTISELQALVQRYSVAVMLKKGLTYHEIAEKTGASTATISRVNRCLNFGADGYKTALDRMKEEDQEIDE